MPLDMAQAYLDGLEPHERPGMADEANPEDSADSEMSYMDWE